jgi:hypothetical protein
LHKPRRVQFRTIRGSGPLPSIGVEPSFQDIAKTADPAKISEQLRHANEQLELTRQRYPARERAQPRGKGHRDVSEIARCIQYIYRSTGPAADAQWNMTMRRF